MTGLKQYPSYRDSGIAWLGPVPQHWEVPRLKQVCKGPPEYGANISSQSYTSDGVRFIRTTDIREDGNLKESNGVFVPEELAAGSLVEAGDFLVSRSGSIGRGLIVDATIPLPAAYAGYLVRFRTKDIPTSRWTFLFTKTVQFQEFISTGISPSHSTPEFFIGTVGSRPLVTA